MTLAHSRSIPLAAATAFLFAPPGVTPAPRHAGLERIVANDNRVSAGTLTHDTLVVRLVLQRAEWAPEGDDGPRVIVEAFGEDGKAPSIPAPLLRIREGTVLRVHVENRLPDSTAHIVGLGAHPVPVTDTLHLAPGRSVELAFPAGAAGTYGYHAVIGNNPDTRESERETAGGAFVVDPPGGSPPDRVFVINIFGNADSSGYRNALAINGRSWPHTERLQATVGDTLRWRVVNNSVRGHPMHLHGFYFRIGAIGTGIASRAIPADRQRLDVTEQMAPWTTRDIAWSPDRPGNWLFHCHLTFHVIPEARLKPRDTEHENHSGDAMKHMAGLVLGVAVSPGANASSVRRGKPRVLELYFTQGPPRGRSPVTYSYILKQGGREPAVDSTQVIGSPLVLTRGEPADIIVINRAREATSIHWHGIELESWSDGVAGWSGQDKTMAPAVLPGQRFTARLTLPRAGTFMYHTHLNDVPQVTGGAVGAIVVLEPGTVFDPAHDHVYVSHWNGVTLRTDIPQSLLVNGDSVGAAPLTMQPGSSHRFRFINIGPANVVRYEIRRDTTLARWTSRAKDGADLPPALRSAAPARLFISVGETFDFDFTPDAPGDYILSAAFGSGPPRWQQRMTVR